MVVISKQLFYEKIDSSLSCKHLYHPEVDSCLKAIIKFSFYCLPGICFLYVPIYLVKCILNYKQMSKKYMKHVFKSYLKSISYGFVMGHFLSASICGLHKYNGKLTYYTICGIPGFFAGLSLLLESRTNHYLNTVLWTNMLIEMLFLKLTFKRPLPIMKETMCFMGISSILMYLLANCPKAQIPPNLWLYQPPAIANSENKNCNHDRKNNNVPCSRYILNGFLTYFGIGFALSSIRNVIYMKLINFSNVRLGLFLGGYVGVFRLATCLLYKLNKGVHPVHPFIAGLLGGSCYAFNPRKSFLTLALTTILQILVKKQNQNLLTPTQSYILEQLLFMITNGLLFQNFVANIDTTPKYFIQTFNKASSGMFTTLHNNLVKKFILN